MNVALYAGMFQAGHDGATQTLQRLIEQMAAEGFRVGVWTFSPSSGEPSSFLHYRLPSMPIPLFPHYRFSLPSASFKQELDRFRPDIIHVAAPDWAGLFLLQYGRRKRIPVAASYHTHFSTYLDVLRLHFLSKSMWNWLSWFYNQVEFVYAPSLQAAQELHTHGVKRIRHWSRGVDRSLFHPSFRSAALRRTWGAKDRKVILYAGRLVPYKSLDIFSEVYDRFQERKPGMARFVLAGDGPMKKKLEERMPEAIFTGFLQGADLSEVYASSDLFLFPSTTETFGNVIQEAIASGIPAVVSDEGGCKEIIRESGAGVIGKAGSPEDFFEKSLRLLEKPDLYRRLQEKGERYSEQRNWSRINEGVIEDYRALHAFQTYPEGWKRKGYLLLYRLFGQPQEPLHKKELSSFFGGDSQDSVLCRIGSGTEPPEVS